jgi:hypothetical protein
MPVNTNRVKNHMSNAGHASNRSYHPTSFGRSIPHSQNKAKVRKGRGKPKKSMTIECDSPSEPKKDAVAVSHPVPPTPTALFFPRIRSMYSPPPIPSPTGTKFPADC